MTARSVLIALCVLSAVAMFAALSVGAAPIALSRIVSALLAPASTQWQDVVVWDLRLPRAIVAWLVGAALSASGCALQALFANPLADPAVLGVSSAAALGAVIAMYIGLGGQASWVVPLFSCGGALLAILVVWLLAGRRGRVEVTSVLLGGVAVGHLAVAASALVVSFALADYRVARKLLQWLLGSLEARTWMHVAWGAGPITVGLLVLLSEARGLDALLLEEQNAVAVGIDVSALRRRLLLWTSVLTGVAVAVGGVVGFVGLVVPHALRSMVGPGHRLLLPASIALGGSFVALADVAARRLIAPEELQLGIVTAAVGAPLFLALLVRLRAERMT